MILRAETCEIVSQWPLATERDVWVEAKGLTPVRAEGPRSCSRRRSAPVGVWAQHRPSR